jgi:AcrR family transcriptional regulator
VGRRRWGTTRGDETYERSVAAGCTLLRRGGVRALSMRRVAEATFVSLGAIQFHFGTHDELARAVIRAWAQGISRALEETAGDARGLSRTWKLCEGWVRPTDGVDVVLGALLVDADCSKHQGARAMVVESLRGWVEETRRSLRQAQLKHELESEVDIRAVALEVHQLLWSRSWTSALLGPEAAARTILNGIRERLCAIAVDPTATLPPPSEILAAPAPEDEDSMEDTRLDLAPTTWRMVLERTDPLFHAFERHEIMGDPRTFVYPPEVTPDDIARAGAFKKKRGAA